MQGVAAHPQKGVTASSHRREDDAVVDVNVTGEGVVVAYRDDVWTPSERATSERGPHGGEPHHLRQRRYLAADPGAGVGEPVAPRLGEREPGGRDAPGLELLFQLVGHSGHPRPWADLRGDLEDDRHGADQAAAERGMDSGTLGSPSALARADTPKEIPATGNGTETWTAVQNRSNWPGRTG